VQTTMYATGTPADLTCGNCADDSQRTYRVTYTSSRHET